MSPVPIPIGSRLGAALKKPGPTPTGFAPRIWGTPTMQRVNAPQGPAVLPANAPLQPIPTAAAPTASIPSPETNPQASSPTLPNVGANAEVFVVQDSSNAAAVKSYPLTTEANFKSLVVTLTAAATSGATAIPATDILVALPAFNILDTNGYRIKLNPIRDFYSLYQRYSRYHDVITPVLLTGTANQQVTVTGTYELVGCRLDQLQGPFTLEVTYGANTVFGSDCTALTTTVAISAIPGLTGGVSLNAVTSTLNPQPIANGVTDLSPTAPITGHALDEFVISGLTSNVNDVSYWQVILNGLLVTNRASSASLVSRAQGRMNGTIPSSVLYMCFSLGTQIAFNRSSHLWANYGTNPATSGVSALYIWYD